MNMYREIRNSRSSNGIENIFGTTEERLNMSEKVKSQLKTGTMFIEVDNKGAVYGFVEETGEWYEQSTGGSATSFCNLGLKMI